MFLALFMHHYKEIIIYQIVYKLNLKLNKNRT
jgi:hypothetical protein